MTDPHGILRAAQAITERPLQVDEVIEVVDALEQLNADEQAYWIGCLQDWGKRQADVIFWLESWTEHWLIEKYDVDDSTYFDHPLCKQFYVDIRPIETLLSDLEVDYPANYTLMPQHFSLQRALPESWTLQDGVYVGPWGKCSLAFEANGWGGFDVSALVEFNENDKVKTYLVDDFLYVAMMRDDEDSITEG